ncbi:hypothetical protein Tco_0033354 [Tanacetum coccineum]
MDYKRTKAYLPRIHRSIHDEDLRESYHRLEGLETFITLNEPICPRFVVEFYHSLEVKRDDEERPYIEFKLGQFTFKLDSSQLSRIFQTPKALETFYTSELSLNSLDDHPNSSFFGPKHDLVRENITVPRTTQTQLQRNPNKLHIDDIRPELRGWELFFRENLFCTLSNRKHVNAWIHGSPYGDQYDVSEEHPNEKTHSPPPRKKSLSPPQALSKSISSKSTHYTSSSSPSDSLTPTHVATPPKRCFVIPLKLEAQGLPSLTSTMDHWPPGPSNPSPPPRVSKPPPGFPHPPPGFEPLPSTQPLFVYINNNAPPLENIYHPPPNLGNQDFPNPLNFLDFVHPNDMPHLHNMFYQCCSTIRHEIQML